MKITKQQLKQIIKEELGRIQEGDIKWEKRPVGKFTVVKPTNLDDAKRDVMMRAIEDYYGLAQGVGSPLAADLDKIIHDDQSLARKDSPTPAFDLGDDEELRLGDVD